jgi:TRAP-type C4-dicarboxylate transport system substrate-binding protein
MISWGLQEVIKHMLLPGFIQVDPTTLVNLDKFNKLPPDLQTALKDSVAKLELIATERLWKDVQREWETMQRAGMRKCELPAADAKKFLDMAYEVTWNKVIKDDPIYGPQFRKLTSK